MREIIMRIAAGMLLLCMGAVAAEGEPPQDRENMARRIQALEARVKDLERCLAQQNAQQDAKQLTQARRKAALEVIKEMNLDANKRATLPKWLEDLNLYGDLRLRYQGECFSGRSEKSRNRARFRLRVGLKKMWLDDQMELGFRLASGSSDDPTSTNQTFDDHFSEKHVWIDLAYAKYKPNWLSGCTIIGGKMKNPLVHTNLVWDSDVNPEGVWAQYKRRLGDLEPFVNVGYFIMDEVHEGHDTTLAAYQAGLNWKITKDVKWTIAGTYYDFDHFDTSYRAANGNDVNDAGNLAAGQFHLINVTNKVGFKAFGLPMSAYFDFIHNCGDKDNTPGYTGQGNGYAVGLKVGKNKKKGDCSFDYKYAYIEANCTPGALNDSDFGGANRKGHVWGAKYNVTDSLTLGGKVFLTEPVTGCRTNQRDITVQLDLVWRF